MPSQDMSAGDVSVFPVVVAPASPSMQESSGLSPRGHDPNAQPAKGILIKPGSKRKSVGAHHVEVAVEDTGLPSLSLSQFIFSKGYFKISLYDHHMI